MRHRTFDPLADQSNSRTPIPHRRGFRQIITLLRIRYLLSRIGPRHALRHYQSFRHIAGSTSDLKPSRA